MSEGGVQNTQQIGNARPINAHASVNEGPHDQNMDRNNIFSTFDQNMTFFASQFANAIFEGQTDNGNELRVPSYPQRSISTSIGPQISISDLASAQSQFRGGGNFLNRRDKCLGKSGF